MITPIRPPGHELHPENLLKIAGFYYKSGACNRQ